MKIAMRGRRSSPYARKFPRYWRGVAPDTATLYTRSPVRASSRRGQVSASSTIDPSAKESPATTTSARG
jgi:hypothetical protein